MVFLAINYLTTLHIWLTSSSFFFWYSSSVKIPLSSNSFNFSILDTTSSVASLIVNSSSSSYSSSISPFKRTPFSHSCSYLEPSEEVYVPWPCAYHLSKFVQWKWGRINKQWHIYVMKIRWVRNSSSSHTLNKIRVWPFSSS